jgi:hypothetical protein
MFYYVHAYHFENHHLRMVVSCYAAERYCLNDTVQYNIPTRLRERGMCDSNYNVHYETGCQS